MARFRYVSVEITDQLVENPFLSTSEVGLHGEHSWSTFFFSQISSAPFSASGGAKTFVDHLCSDCLLRSGPELAP